MRRDDGTYNLPCDAGEGAFRIVESDEILYWDVSPQHGYLRSRKEKLATIAVDAPERSDYTPPWFRDDGQELAQRSADGLPWRLFGQWVLRPGTARWATCALVIEPEPGASAEGKAALWRWLTSVTFVRK